MKNEIEVETNGAFGLLVFCLAVELVLVGLACWVYAFKTIGGIVS